MVQPISAAEEEYRRARRTWTRANHEFGQHPENAIGVTRLFVMARTLALVAAVGVALASCQHSAGHPPLTSAPTPEAARVFCGAAKVTPTTAEGFRLLTVTLSEGQAGLAGAASHEGSRFLRAANDYINAATAERTYLQGGSATRDKQQLDRELESAQQGLLATCKSLPAGLLAGRPLPFPKAHESLDTYCSVAGLPHNTPAELDALTTAASVSAFRNTARNKAIAAALMNVTAAAEYAAFVATQPPALQKLQADAPISKQPAFNLPLALSNLRVACR